MNEPIPEGFTVPANAAPTHNVLAEVPREFAEVIRVTAEKEGRTFNEQLIQFAICGADCQRIHREKDRR